MREKILTITIKDCEVQTFSAGGKGGQNQNRRSSGVRVIHPPSGARGESREERSQLQNKKKAFRRMAESATFQSWVKMEHLKTSAWLEDQMRPENLIIEYYTP